MRSRLVRHSGAVARIASLVLVIASCGGGDDGTGPPTGNPPGGGGGGSTSNSIDVRDNSYSPSATTVPVGTTVTWTWRGQAAHDVMFSATEKSDVQATGTYQRQFSAAGTYDYNCSIHGTAMSGRVVVQ
jgi:plastocyanin